MKRQIDIFYQGECVNGIDHLKADPSETLAVTKSRLIEKHGADPSSMMFAEDADSALEETRTTGDVAESDAIKIHLHRCRHVAVTVTFTDKTAERSFGPGVTLARIKRWAAVKEFGMSAEDAGEHVLQLSGSDERPTPGTHVGALSLGPECHVAFDLVPDERINGSTELEDGKP